MSFRFGSTSQSSLARCHATLQALAARALELTTQDFTVTAGDRLCLAVAPYPAAAAAEAFGRIAAAFKDAAREQLLVLRWSGDFHFFADPTRFEIDAPADGQRIADPAPAPAGKTDGSALTPALRADYESLYARAAIRPDRQVVVSALVRRMVDAARWPRYVAVAAAIGVPACCVALIHAMESGLDFSRHLHNGDPLSARTVRVPKGRPASGTPPFAWEESAADALRLHGLDAWTDWSLAGMAYVLERYNGFGYRLHHPAVPSPYLWSFTTVYTAGKYVSDKKWSDTAVSKQCGAMALLRELAACGESYGAAAVVSALSPVEDSHVR